MNTGVGASYYTLVFYFPAHEPLQKWTGEMLLDLINSWVVVGIAVIIAAFSQWRTISLFHLFICSNLASTIPIFNPTATGIIKRHSNRSMLQRAYFTFYVILRIALSVYLIYRFGFWGNTPGQCFVIPQYSLQMLGATLRIVWDTLFNTPVVGWLIKATSRQHEIQGTPQERLEALKQESARIQLRDSVISLMALWFAHVVPLIWNAYWTTTVVLANQGHVLGDEYIFTFGQVGALVVFFASFYTIGNSYLRKRWTASW